MAVDVGGYEMLGESEDMDDFACNLAIFHLLLFALGISASVYIFLQRFANIAILLILVVISGSASGYLSDYGGFFPAILSLGAISIFLIVRTGIMERYHRFLYTRG